MKKIIYILLSFVIGLVVGIGSQYININKPKKAALNDTPTPEQIFEKSQEKNTVNIPAKYFDVETFEYGGMYTLKGLFSSEPPEPIVTDEIIQVLNEDIPKFDCKENEFCPQAKYTDEIDVDNDGKKEKILRIWMGTNHGVADLYIIKDKRVIFKIQDKPADIEASKSNNGFYLNLNLTTFLGVLGSKSTTRYIYDEGKFIPVWRQTFHEVGTSQP